MAVKDMVASAVETAKQILGQQDDANENDGQPPGDAIALLKADHREAEALFKTILSDESLTLRGQRANIEKVLAALTLHAKIEEALLYPAVYSKTKRDTDERLDVLEAYEEHGSMKDLMRKIARADARDETLKAKVQVLSEITKHHVTEEESKFFHEAREILGDKRLTAIGAEIRTAKARAEKRSSLKGGKVKASRVTAKRATAKKKRASA